MQVFLPVASVVESLEILDDRRLAKQRVEAKQLIDTILDRPMLDGKLRKGWQNHPAAVMFRNYVPILVFYYNTSLVVHASRGGKNIKLKPEPDNFSHKAQCKWPWWWGMPEFHASHRSRLLFKGKVDVLADRIRRHFQIRSVNDWLSQKGWPSLNQLRQPEYERLTQILDNLGAQPSSLKNYYEQFGWTEPDTLEYVWPGEIAIDGVRTLR